MNHLIGAIGNGTVRAVLTPQAKKRQLISLRGKDSFKFLQSMSTKKVMTHVEADESGEFCDFASFLNSKGRLVSDALMMYRSTSRSWLLDVPSASVQPLLSHFQQYKMRNEIMLDIEEANKTYQIYTLVATNETNLKELSLWLLNRTSQLDLLFYQDPRFPLALRLVVPTHINPKQHLPPLGDIYEEEDADNRSIYEYLRNMNGIPEGAPQVVSGTSIPFECDFDLLNGIDYNKGCYLGQELVARTHYRGAVRKRLFPLVSLGSPQSLLKSSKMPNSELVSTLMEANLATGEHVVIPQAMLKPVSSQSTSSGSGSSGKKVHANLEVTPWFDVANEFPVEGAPIVPISNQADLEAVLAGNPLPLPPGAAAGRVSKVVGGSSWHVGMGMMRTDAWHSSPSLLFYVPATKDNSSGILLKGSKPWWYDNYLQWRQEAESKAVAQAAEDL